MKFLIDECLSPHLVETANRAGHDAQHVVHLGRAGWKDWNVLAFAIERERIFVTNNAADFRKLYARQELHPGLVVILPNADRVSQQRLFLTVLTRLAELGHLTNQVIETDLVEDEVVLTRYSLPP